MKKILLAVLAFIVMAGAWRNEAGAAPAPCFSEEIADIESHWGREDMAALARMGIMAGYPESANSGGEEKPRFYFLPDKNVTRAEFAVILAGALGLEGDDQAGVFADRDDIPWWAAGPVGALYKQGILKGFPRAGGGVDFKPGSEINRAELAAMFAVAVKGGAGGDPPGFLDVPPGSWYAGAVQRAYSLGITRGRSGDVFAPLDAASRAEVAAMTVRLLEKDAGLVPPDGQLAGVVENYYKALSAALGGGDASDLLSLADGGFYLGLTRGGAGLWENIPGLDARVTVSPGQPDVTFKSGRLARVRCVSGFSGSPDDPGGEALTGEVAESFYLRRSGEVWRIYHTEVEDISLNSRR